MRGLHLLIELARREADERRSQLAEISFAKADTEAALVAHRDGIASEGRVAFDDPAIHEGKLLLSKPYHKTGVALLIPSGHPEVKRFDDVPKGSKVGVMVGSLAQTRLGQRGLTTSPYSLPEGPAYPS